MDVASREIGSKRDWFRFVDREAFTPIRGGEVVTHALRYSERGSLHDPTWVKEEWKIDALVAPLAAIQSFQKILETLEHEFIDCDHEFKPYWDEHGFNFQESISMYGLTLQPWVSQYRDIAKTRLRLMPRSDFLTYHCLEGRRVDENDVDYVLPLTSQTVLRTRCEDIAYFAPMANTVVHVDYLRDFLAARNAVLILSIVADRFLNASTIDDLQLDEAESERIGEYASITTTIHPPDSTDSGFARGRSSLYWNILVPAYECPKPSRSFWPNFGFESTTPEHSPVPTFFADFNARRITAAEAGRLTYLYFQPQVLQKYLTVAGYSVYFIMRHWGRANGPHDDGIDVGINSRNLVTAYARDIASLNSDEQAYWSSYSCIPDGEVCKELFETRMQQNPPHSPNSVELLIGARDAVDEAFEKRYGRKLYKPFELTDREQQRLSVGPVHPAADEISALAQALYECVIAPMDIVALRAALDSVKCPWQGEWRQIKLLEALIETTSARTDSRALTAPLRIINDLRVKQAHSVSRSVEDILVLYGVSVRPFVARTGWLRVVDVVNEGIRNIAVTLNAK